MSDTTDTETDNTPAGLRAAHAAEKEGRTAAEREAAQLRKELLFTKAGITTDDDGAGQLLFESWNGTDLDELRAKAIKVGALKTTPEPQQEQQVTPQQQQQQAMGDLIRGGQGAGGGGAVDHGADPSTTALETFRKSKVDNPLAIAQADGMEAFFKSVAAGDKRTRWDKSKHAAEAAAYDAATGAPR